MVGLTKGLRRVGTTPEADTLLTWPIIFLPFSGMTGGASVMVRTGWM